MTKEEAIEVEGLVLEILGGGKYKVQIIDMDMAVEAYAAGKMKKFRIKIIPGDLVTVELNPYEPTKGRIVYRTINSKDKRRPPRGGGRGGSQTKADKKAEKRAAKKVESDKKKAEGSVTPEKKEATDKPTAP